MRATITGASGFIGSRMLERLTALKVPARVVLRRGLSGRASNPLCECVRGDVTDPETLRAAMRGCDTVFHCAWGGTTLADARRINVDGTRNVLEAAASEGVRRVVHLSSLAVHGQRLPPVLSEEYHLQLRGDPYGVSKAEGELVAFERSRALGVEVVALRPTLVYGPRSPLWLVSYFERVKTEQLALIDGGAGLANLVFVDDVVDAMWAAATRPGVAGEAFLISAAHAVTWREYIGHFAHMCGKPLPPSVPFRRAWCEVQWMRFYHAFTQRPRRLRGMDLQLMAHRATVSIDKARRLLGYNPSVSLAEGMRRCAAWLRQDGHLPYGPSNGADDTSEADRPRERCSAIG